jgi:thioredoxin-related protein
MKSKFIIATAALLVMVSTAVYSVESVDSELAPSAEEFFDVSFGDLTEELNLVREEDKTGVLIMFESKDCPWCHRMKLNVLNRVAVQDYFHKNFRILSLDAEGDVLITDFDGKEVTSKEFALKAMRVRATPVFAFYDKEGELVTRYTGALKNAHDFLLLGQFVVDGHYKSSRFSKFRRENQPS